MERLQFLRSTFDGPDITREPLRFPLRTVVVTLGLAMAGVAVLQSFNGMRGTFPSKAVRAVPEAALATLAAPAASSAVPDKPGGIWIVESSKLFDLYSNGLRVENQFATGTGPRSYFALDRAALDEMRGEWSREPAGIVYHTTESHMAPFEEDANGALKRDGEGLLEYVTRRRAYHFLIDRFGRVFRIVRESDYANHAGNSVWADRHRVYVGLNQSFLGVAFEAQSSHDGEPVNNAQVHAGRVLTDMLRVRYQIPATNCVAHAQVSVNPANWRAGYHVDWAVNLPYEDLGLPDNYLEPLPAIMLFGFEADSGLRDAGGPRLAQAIASAETELAGNATARGATAESYRRALQRRFRGAVTAQRNRDVTD